VTIDAISRAAVFSRPHAERELLQDQLRHNHALPEALEWKVVEEITVHGENCPYYRLEDTIANPEIER